MAKTLTRDECLALSVEEYNRLISMQHPDTKFSNCEYCGRLHTMCCICNEARDRWQSMVDEISAAEKNRSDEYERKRGPILQNTIVTDALQHLLNTLEREYGEIKWGVSIDIFAGKYTAVIKKNHS